MSRSDTHSWSHTHPLKHRMQRFRLSQEIEDVWDFGRPDRPRSREDYNRDVLWPRSGIMHQYVDQMEARKRHELCQGSSIVTSELVDLLVPLCEGKVIEVFAGTGWLSAHLRHRQVDMLTLDNGSTVYPKTWTEIDSYDVVEESMDANVIIMQYPPDHMVAQQVVMKMQHHALLLYMGVTSNENGRKLPTTGFWHHLSRSDHDVRLERKLQLAQPLWASQHASWQAFIKR